MGLQRELATGSYLIWEVDGSGLFLVRARERPGRYWLDPGPGQAGSTQREAAEYLERHALLDQHFPSRTRALDALRLALLRETRRVPSSRTRWQRTGENNYLSRDRHWRLERKGEHMRLTPLSPAARVRLEADPELKEKLLTPSRGTLAACARHVDWLNEELDLGGPTPLPGEG